MKLDQSQNQIWDYIIVGTGMGGGPVGLKLAQAGYSVLFLEKGGSPKSTTSLKGKFAELFPMTSESKKDHLKKAGRFNQDIYDCTTSTPKKIEPFIGSGVGGSSALYGAVLERFQASNFAQWPISYSTFESYYTEAEQLFRIHTNENVNHPGNQHLFDHLKSQGLHPYILPLAVDKRKECESCQSFLCAKGCKNDSRKICIDQAVQNHGAALLVDCDVQKIEFKNKTATGVTGTWSDQSFSFEARHVIVAAGALQSPLLLERSGIGFQSGLLGRNLMRHFVDLYAMKIDSDLKNPNAKEIGFNDFYNDANQSLGTVQSFGRLPPLEVILQDMESNLKSHGWGLATLFRFLKPIVSPIIKRVTSGRLVMASIMEDSPQCENRVWSENGRICIAYKISRKDKARIDIMRANLKSIFQSFSLLFIPNAQTNKMLAHVCGTCKMGIDPLTSVVDPSNKVHGTENVYVVDSSFFPTSGGTNPALTIAANSLRVADLLILFEKSKKPHERYEVTNPRFKLST